MSQGNKRVSSCNVIGHDSYDELVSRLASMNIALENEMAKTRKLENENSFLKKTCEEQKHLLYVITCSHEELKMAHEELSVTHDNLVLDHAFITKELSNEKTKTSESSLLGSHDQSHDVANLYDVGKKHISTSCDDLLYMSCSSQIYSYSTSIYCETNILKENNGLKNKVKNLSNKLESKSKGKNKKMQEEKICHFMCYRFHDMGHLAKYCPTKRAQVEPKEKSQNRVQVNYQDGDLGMMMKKKKTRRGGKARARHHAPNQDAQKLSKIQDEKNDHAHIKYFKCKYMIHFASRCPTKLENKIQAKLKRQGNEKQHIRKEEKVQSKRVCYSCRKRGHMANSCPLGNNSKPISINDDIMFRKDGNGTSFVAIAKHPTTHTKVVPKHVAPNLRGPKLVWVLSKSG
jgi:hypothetical protein